MEAFIGCILCYNLHFYRNKEMQIVISDIYIIKSILRVIDFCLDIFYLCTFALFNICMISKRPANRRAVSAGAFSTWWRYQPHHSQYYKSRDHKSRDHKILLERETMQWHRKSHLNVAFVPFFFITSACKCNSTVTITLLSLVIDFLGKYWETWYVQFHRRRCQ